MLFKKENLPRVLTILLGSLIYAIGVNGFLIPHKLLSGGVAGVSIIAQYLTGMSSGYFVILFNIPIFLLGMRVIDKDFGFFSFVGMMSMSLFLILTKNFSTMNLMRDPLLSTLCGGVITGIGSGIIFKSKASEGGTDIVSVIVKKKYGMSIGNVSFGINCAVVAMGMFIGTLESAIYTLISMFVKSVFIDKVIEGFNKEKVLFVISQNSDQVQQAITKELGRGVTYLYGEGAYTGEKKKVIYTILCSKEIVKAKEIINNIDSKAFVSIMDTTEVQGKGFKPALY